MPPAFARYGRGSTEVVSSQRQWLVCHTWGKISDVPMWRTLIYSNSINSSKLFYMYIPPSPMSPSRLTDCFSDSVPPCQGAGSRTPASSARHPCTCRIIVSDHIELSIPSGACDDSEMAFPRGIGMCCEGRRRSIDSIRDVGSAAAETKAAQVAWMRFGGKNGRRK